jgi:hypothetical protein
MGPTISRVTAPRLLLLFLLLVTEAVVVVTKAARNLVTIAAKLGTFPGVCSVVYGYSSRDQG